MSSQHQHTNWLHNTPSFSRTYTRRMSFLSLPPHIHSTSPPLYDDEMRQVEDYLADQQAIDAAEQERLREYLAAAAAAPAPEPAPEPAPDAVAVLAQNMRLLVVPEDEEEELDTHTCGDSECQGIHVHADEGDYYGISPSYSPNNSQYNYYDQPYIPATPPYD